MASKKAAPQRALNDKRDADAPVTIAHALQDCSHLEALLTELVPTATSVSAQLILAGVQNQYLLAMHWACRITLDDDAIEACQDDQEQSMAQVEALRATKLPENVTLAQAKKVDAAVAKEALFDVALVQQLCDRARQRLTALAEQLSAKKKVAPKTESLQDQLSGLALDPDAAAALASLGSSVSTTSLGCAACGKEPAESLCGRCRSRRYCSVTCQRQDWSVHKPSCKAPTSPQ